MIRLHCTKKLLEKLPLKENGRICSKQPNTFAANDTPETLLSGWHANLILFQRRQCVLFLHDKTRFPVFVNALKKPDFAELEWFFVDGFMNTLLKTGANNEMMERAHSLLGPLVCDNQCSRSVQGTLNRMKQDLDYKIWGDNLSIMDIAPYSTGAWLADRPCTAKDIKDCIWPLKAMHELLMSES
jgi:hypothetical protein